MLQVEFAVLATEAVRMEAVADAIEARITRARSRMDELIGSGWSGAAADAMAAEFREWDEAATAAVRELRGLVSELHGSAADFAAAEEHNLTVATTTVVPTSLIESMGGDR
jgi:WXG100 family type VII secretion target